MKYKSIEEIETEFKTKLDATEDADTRAVLVEQRAEAKADFRAAQAEAKFKADADAREAQVKARERQAWIRVAFVEFPLAQEVPELVAGDTEEAVKKSAQAAHERIWRLQNEAVERSAKPADTSTPSQTETIQQATQAYGNVAVGGGNPPPEVSEREKFLQDYVSKYNSDRSGQFGGERRNINPAETDAYVRARGGPHLLERMLGPAEQKYGPSSPMAEAIKQHLAHPGQL